MKFLVRVDITYSAVVEAASKDEAIAQAPPIPDGGAWDQSSASDYEAEKESE